MRPALLVIDMQRWCLEVGPQEKLAGVETLIAKTNDLIDFFHERNLPVVQVRVIHKADGSTWNQWMREHRTGHMIEGTWEVEGHPDVHTGDADVVVAKTRHSAFIRTELEHLLREREADTVVMAGFATNGCVGLTAIDAWERDFRIMLAGEAILGITLDDGALMLDYLRNRFEIEPVSNAEIEEVVGKEAGH